MTPGQNNFKEPNITQEERATIIMQDVATVYKTEPELIRGTLTIERKDNSKLFGKTSDLDCVAVQARNFDKIELTSTSVEVVANWLGIDTSQPYYLLKWRSGKDVHTMDAILTIEETEGKRLVRIYDIRGKGSKRSQNNIFNYQESRNVEGDCVDACIFELPLDKFGNFHSMGRIDAQSGHYNVTIGGTISENESDQSVVDALAILPFFYR